MLVTLYVFINLGAGLPVQPYPLITDMPVVDCQQLLVLNPMTPMGCGIELGDLVPEAPAEPAEPAEPAQLAPTPAVPA